MARKRLQSSFPRTWLVESGHLPTEPLVLPHRSILQSDHMPTMSRREEDRRQASRWVLLRRMLPGARSTLAKAVQMAGGIQMVSEAPRFSQAILAATSICVRMRAMLYCALSTALTHSYTLLFANCSSRALREEHTRDDGTTTGTWPSRGHCSSLFHPSKGYVA